MHQVTQSPLNSPVEAFLGPPAEYPKTPPDHRVWDGGPPGVTADSEGHLAGRQVFDHLIAEPALLQMALKRLVAPAPNPFGSDSAVPGFVDHPGDPYPQIEPQPEEAAFQQHVAAEQFVAVAVHRP